jgi:glycosyltransferase involved in cell wall biosynthesis
VSAPTLSIVAPVYNEARIVSELVARCARAGEQAGVPFEIIIVDDASTDDTPRLLAELARDYPLRPCRLPANLGQFGATQAGLRAASGQCVVVLDGDLQDPPEHIPRLVETLSAAPPSVVAVLAVKAHRDDPLPFMIGQFVFHRLQQAVSRIVVPRGAGSYCVMRRGVARRVASAALTRANLSVMVAVAARAMGGALAVLPYDKGPRYDRSGRVGWRRLLGEALESWAVTGVLTRLLTATAFAFALAALVGPDSAAGRLALLAAGVAVAGLSVSLTRRTQRALAAMHAPDGGD